MDKLNFKTSYNIFDKLKISFQNIKKMISYRNEDITLLNSISDIELFELYDIHDKIFSIKANENTKIIYYLHQKIQRDNIQKILDNDNEKKYLYILITLNTLDKRQIKSVKELKTKNEIQIFEIKELLYCLYEHELVPKHIIIDDKQEIEEIKKTYNIKSLDKLPLILSKGQFQDPVVKYLNIKSGNVVKIIRPSLSAGEYITYRYCK
jgi:DNA-directed RNA polymerase I, II, and III subunit RPABC1